MSFFPENLAKHKGLCPQPRFFNRPLGHKKSTILIQIFLQQMNDTDALEERVVILEAEMDIVQSTLVILQDEVGEVQDDVDVLETEDSLFDQRLILVEAEIADNEDAIDGDIDRP